MSQSLSQWMGAFSGSLLLYPGEDHGPHVTAELCLPLLLFESERPFSIPSEVLHGIPCGLLRFAICKQLLVYPCPEFYLWMLSKSFHKLQNPFRLSLRNCGHRFGPWAHSLERLAGRTWKIVIVVSVSDTWSLGVFPESTVTLVHIEFFIVFIFFWELVKHVAVWTTYLSPTPVMKSPMSLLLEVGSISGFLIRRFSYALWRPATHFHAGR